MADWTGIGRYTRGLVSGLLQLAEVEDLQLTLVVAPHQRHFSERRSPLQLVTAGKPPLSLGGLREIARTARDVSPDVLHCTHISTPRPATPVPLVTTIHDLTPLVVEDSMPSAARRRVYRSLNARAVKRSAALIVPSQATAGDVATYFPPSAEKLHVIPEAADDFISAAKQLMPEFIEKLPPAPFFLSMGNTKPHKNLPVLLEAFSRLDSDAQLLLVGAGESAYLDAHLTGPARERIFFTGRVSDDELRWLYAHALAFVFPSRYEGFGLPPLEAAGFGAPVLAADASSLPEVMGDGALYFDASDAAGLAQHLTCCLHEPELLEALSAAATERAHHFSWLDTARATLAVYRRLMD